MGVLLYWLLFVISTILWFQIIFNIRNRNNKRVKRPIWLYFLIIPSLIIPIVNLTFPFIILGRDIIDKEYELKSIFTKEL